MLSTRAWITQREIQRHTQHVVLSTRAWIIRCHGVDLMSSCPFSPRTRGSPRQEPAHPTAAIPSTRAWITQHRGVMRAPPPAHAPESQTRPGNFGTAPYTPDGRRMPVIIPTNSAHETRRTLAAEARERSWATEIRDRKSWHHRPIRQEFLASSLAKHPGTKRLERRELDRVQAQTGELNGGPHSTSHRGGGHGVERGLDQGKRDVDGVHLGANQSVGSRHESARIRMIRRVDHVVHGPGAMSLPVDRKRLGIPVAEFIAEPLAEDLSAFHGLPRAKLLVVAVAPPGLEQAGVPGTRPRAVDPTLRKEVEHLDLVVVVLLSLRDGSESGPMALEGTLVDQAETRRLRSDRRIPEHRVDTFVGVAFVDTEGGMAPSEVPQPSDLPGLLVANRVVANCRTVRAPAQNPPNRPVLGIGWTLGSGEEVQVDPVLGDEQEMVDVLVDQPRLVGSPERSPDFR